jgi:hypothetical protein
MPKPRVDSIDTIRELLPFATEAEAAALHALDRHEQPSRHAVSRAYPVTTSSKSQPTETGHQQQFSTDRKNFHSQEYRHPIN